MIFFKTATTRRVCKRRRSRTRQAAPSTGCLPFCRALPSARQGRGLHFRTDLPLQRGNVPFSVCFSVCFARIILTKCGFAASIRGVSPRLPQAAVRCAARTLCPLPQGGQQGGPQRNNTSPRRSGMPPGGGCRTAQIPANQLCESIAGLLRCFSA